MNANKKLTSALSPKIFKQIKSYNYAQFVSFVESIYRQGYLDGQQSNPGVGIEEVLSALEGAKGIGPARLKEIEYVLNTIL